MLFLKFYFSKFFSAGVTWSRKDCLFRKSYFNRIFSFIYYRLRKRIYCYLTCLLLEIAPRVNCFGIIILFSISYFMLFEFPLKKKMPNSMGFSEKLRLLFNIIGVKKLLRFSKKTMFAKEFLLIF
jgi:hypothetical protein